LARAYGKRIVRRHPNLHPALCFGTYNPVSPMAIAALRLKAPIRQQL
jgi:hypothetical protein